VGFFGILKWSIVIENCRDAGVASEGESAPPALNHFQAYTRAVEAGGSLHRLPVKDSGHCSLIFQR
jgi:hypothetical protein